MNTIELASTQELIMELLTRGEMVLAMSTAVDGEPDNRMYRVHYSGCPVKQIGLAKVLYDDVCNNMTHEPKDHDEDA